MVGKDEIKIRDYFESKGYDCVKIEGGGDFLLFKDGVVSVIEVKNPQHKTLSQTQRRMARMCYKHQIPWMRVGWDEETKTPIGIPLSSSRELTISISSKSSTFAKRYLDNLEQTIARVHREPDAFEIAAYFDYKVKST